YKALEIGVRLLTLLFAISFHESAHAWTALKFGDPTARDLGRISLNPIRHIDPFGTILLPLLGLVFGGGLFGYAKPTPVNLRNTRNPRLANFAVSAAGPISNFVAAVGCVVLLVAIRLASPETIAGLLSGSLPGGVLAPIAFVLLQLLLINL